MRNIPIGISDFKKIIDNNYYYIDKTELVTEFFNSGIEVALTTRPRRFGKTLNVSMLKYFFEKTTEDNRYLFRNTVIWENQEFIKKHQGQYPVIFLTFKDVKDTNWDSAFSNIIDIISEEFIRHQDLLLPTLRFNELEQYNSILLKTANQATYANSLKFLSRLLHSHYQKKVFILIDEYDTPIQTAYINGFYEEMSAFFRGLLPAALKDNINLERGFLTGILTIAKAGIFSGLNNLQIFTLTDPELQDKFGFTEPEISQLLRDYNLEQMKTEVDKWYDGYIFGSTKIYNPWSLLNFVYKKGDFQLYWINTANNQLIKKLIEKSLQDVKRDLEILLSGETVTKEIDKTTVFIDLAERPNAIWSLFLFTGYLTYQKCNLTHGKLHCDLTIPNNEIRILYEDFIKQIFSYSLKTNDIDSLFKAITEACR